MARVRLPNSRGLRAPKTFFSPAPPRVLAHRGFAIDAPENTLLAFLAALTLGITHIETDVQASRDGIAVISHDPDLWRLTGSKVRVNELTMAELRAIDLGEGQTFCSLGEALEAFPDARFNIDIKSRDAVGPAAEAILAANAVSRVLVASFSDGRRASAVRRLPGVATSASASQLVMALFAAKLGLSGVVRLALRQVDAVQVPERVLGFAVTTTRMIRLFHSAGVEVHVWTINDPATMRLLFARGVDGIVTDRADLALKVVRDVG